MRRCLLLLLALAPVYAQSPIASKPVETNFKNLKPGDVLLKPLHIHTIPYNCKGKPDHVYAKRKDVYFACVNGKDVCSAEKGAVIPARLKANFEAQLREQARRREEARAFRQRVRSELDAAAADKVRVAGSRRALGRGSVIEVSSDTGTPAAAPPPIADELVKGISIGAARAEVVQKLGEPYMKISGGGEYFTYRLTSGSTAELDFADGKLTKLRIVPPR